MNIIINIRIFVIISFICIYKFNFVKSKQTEIGTNVTKILNQLLNESYDKRVRPNYAGQPVEVGITMHIISISSISEVNMDFTADFYFRQMWSDTRLSFEPQPGIDSLYVGAEVAGRIWVPDTFFANEKSAQLHTIPIPNTYLRIKSNGDILHSIRLTLTSSCPMNLQYFPMDRQLCTIEIESYGYSMADIVYKWGKGPGSVGIANNLELPQFKVTGLRQFIKTEQLSTGNYSRLVCEMEFVRSMGHYLLQVYIPAILVVIISWFSFWLPRKSTTARVQLGVTTVLTMTTLMYATNASKPKISYINCIDVFLGICFIMVFASLLECAIVGYMAKRIAMRYERVESKTLSRPSIDYKKVSIVAPGSDAEEGTVANKGAPPPALPIPDSKHPNTLFGVCPGHIDKYSRVVFPVCFICFNLWYWYFYMNYLSFIQPE